MFDLEVGRAALSELLVVDIEEDQIAQVVAARVGGEEFLPCLFGEQRRDLFMLHRHFNSSEDGSRWFSPEEAGRGTKEPEKAKELAREFLETYNKGRNARVVQNSQTRSSRRTRLRIVLKRTPLRKMRLGGVQKRTPSHQRRTAGRREESRLRRVSYLNQARASAHRRTPTECRIS